MKHLMPFDEVNRLEEDLVYSTYEEDGKLKSRKDRDECIDLVWDILCLAYTSGTEAVANEFGIRIEPNADDMNDAIFKRFDGKDFRDRVGEYYDTGDYTAINRVIETDSHRVYNDAILNAVPTVEAETEKSEGSAPHLMKKWVTMKDPRVRPTHDYLEGEVKEMSEYFYTFDGDYSLKPGGFIDPSNNINCRCALDIIRQ